MLPNVEKLPDPLIKMLYRTPQELRNSTLLFLVPFLKNTMGLKTDRIIEVMLVWGKRCSPALPQQFIISEVNRLTSIEFRGKYGKYGSEMAKAFGYFEFNQLTKEHIIKVPNAFFGDMSVMEDGSYRIFLALILDKADHEQKNYVLKDICDLSGLKKGL